MLSGGLYGRALYELAELVAMAFCGPQQEGGFGEPNVGQYVSRYIAGYGWRQ